MSERHAQKQVDAGQRLYQIQLYQASRPASACMTSCYHVFYWYYLRVGPCFAFQDGIWMYKSGRTDQPDRTVSISSFDGWPIEVLG